ncbi:hypothetical protein SAMN04515674_11877 [Pseudarcicella hirudinis]|uniref:Methylamine utilisation protein MauE domain-containing protein n=1 Tax=Pseudarcicella hirudinis TaxID=1079859 RepID=A0A1I5YEX9_9BACT|nr:BT_3928 family protein [Pseudarcicella hirudinis]SFQ42759.1 hypothetical protein SAMN04515674_11877 [Pseudarcicella hirudinis]
MRYIAQFSRVLVGIVFIFSGLIKLNDPVGTEIKLEEYFDVFATDFVWSAGFWHSLVPYALFISVFMCALEVILGVALLVSYRLKFTSWVLLAMVIYFAFLTFYSAYYNKVTDCGCFGETIKLKPWTSFWKDIILMFFILIILWQRKIFSQPKTGWIVGLTTVLCVVLGIYAIRHLPPYDGLPYAVGQNIQNNMKPSEALKFKYIYEKNGEKVELETMPTDTSYHFKELITLNQDAAKAKITDYNIWKDGDSTDYKAESFTGNKLMIIVPVISKVDFSNISKIRDLANSLNGSAVTVWLLSSSSDEEVNNFRHSHQLAFPQLSADIKVLKTISRSSPGIWLLKDGTVKGKWSHNDTPTKDEVLEKLK